MYFIDQSSTKNIYTFTGLALSTPILKTCGLCLPKSSTFSGGLPAGISWQNELTPNINNYVIGRLVGIATETGVFNSTVVFYGEYRGMAYPEGNTTREIIDVTITVQELPPPPPSVANFKIIDSITNEIIFETGEVSTNGSVISGEISMTTCDFHPCVHGLFGSWQYSLDGCGIKTISAGGVGNGCATETETETETDTETPTDTETESETETETLSNCSNTCFGSPCGPISFVNEYGYYVPVNSETSYEISKQAFDSFQLGGTINWSSSINIDYGSMACDFSYSNSISIPPKTCDFQDEGYSESPTCINDCSYYGSQCPPWAPTPSPVHSSTGISGRVFSEEGKYYLYVSGYIQCPIGNGTTICSRVYKNAGKNYSSGEGGSFSLLGATIGYDVDSTWNMSFSPNPSS